jgi:RES domain-containing protein
MELSDIPTRREPWAKSVRIVSSRFPPTSLFDRVADPRDLDAIFALEGLTNPRIRHELGDLSLVPPEERVTGPGTTPIMAAFTHLNPSGSRFADGTFGAYYAARHVDTAIRETAYHRERFLRDGSIGPLTLQMRVYYADLQDKAFHDIRGMKARAAAWYDPNNYAASQKLGAALRENNSWGIFYDSVRHDGGECIAVFRPRALGPVIQGPHFGYVWDGTRISQVHELRELLTL